VIYFIGCDIGISEVLNRQYAYGEIFVGGTILFVKAQNNEVPLIKYLRYTKELKMSFLTLCRSVSTAVGESIMGSIADAFGDNIRPETTSPIIASLPMVRRKKIIRLRQQLANGTYDLDERLDAVLDRILMDITPRVSSTQAS
jgi:hypothetical protein